MSHHAERSAASQAADCREVSPTLPPLPARYLVVLRLLHRDYEAAAQVLPSCWSDTPLTREQQWVLALASTRPRPSDQDHIQRTADKAKANVDPHPDALAIRLRLAIMCFNADTSPPFDVGSDYQQYIGKANHASPACVLTQGDEMAVCRALGVVAGGSSGLASRMMFLVAVTNLDAVRDEAGSHGHGRGEASTATTPPPDVRTPPRRPVMKRQMSMVPVERVVESPHPVPNGEREQVIHIPGAVQLSVQFLQAAMWPATGDYVTICGADGEPCEAGLRLAGAGPGFEGQEAQEHHEGGEEAKGCADDSHGHGHGHGHSHGSHGSHGDACDDGCESGCGDASCKAGMPRPAWPGAGSTPPLVVQGDTLRVVTVARGAGTESWGWQMSVTALVPFSSVTAARQAAVDSHASQAGADGQEPGPSVARARRIAMAPVAPSVRGSSVAKIWQKSDLLVRVFTEQVQCRAAFQYMRSEERHLVGDAADKAIQAFLRTCSLTGRGDRAGFALLYDLLRGEITVDLLGGGDDDDAGLKGGGSDAMVAALQSMLSPQQLAQMAEAMNNGIELPPEVVQAMMQLQGMVDQGPPGGEVGGQDAGRGPDPADPWQHDGWVLARLLIDMAMVERKSLDVMIHADFLVLVLAAMSGTVIRGLNDGCTVDGIPNGDALRSFPELPFLQGGVRVVVFVCRGCNSQSNLLVFVYLSVFLLLFPCEPSRIRHACAWRWLPPSFCSLHCWCFAMRVMACSGRPLWSRRSCHHRSSAASRYCQACRL